MKTIAIGTILKRRLDGFSGVFLWHWGVCTGDRKVTHFNGYAKKERSAIIRLDTMRTFAAGHSVLIHRRPDSLREGIEIARKAGEIRSLATNGYNGKYHLVINNCQDFCRHCCDA